MDVYYDDFKKGKNVHRLHDYSYSENTDNANCACKPCEKPYCVSNFRIIKEVSD